MSDPPILLDVERLAQPDDLTCGPTSLLQLYRYYGDDRPLERVIADTPRKPDGGTLAVYLGQSALASGFRPALYSYNLRVFDPSWWGLAPPALLDKLRRRAAAVESEPVRRVVLAYADFVAAGGEVRFRDLDKALLVELLRSGQPILTGLSATYLYRARREFGDADDDVRGEPMGHFVVVAGYDPGSDEFTVCDPSNHSPFSPSGRYAVAAERLIASILLGDATDDAVLLVLGPPAKGGGGRRAAAEAPVPQANRTAARPSYLIVTDPPVSPVVAAHPHTTADRYLGGDPETLDDRLVVINLCRSYQYLSKGYYVSLVAEARHQRVLPSLGMIEEIDNPFAYLRALQEAGVKTIDFKIQHGRRAVPRVIVVGGREGEPVREGGAGTRSTALVSRPDPAGGLRFEQTDRGYLDVAVAFGRPLDDRFRRLAGGVYRTYAFPLLRVRMYEGEEGWRVGQVYPATIHQLKPEELALLGEQLGRRPFLEAPPPPPAQKPHRIACLWDPDDETAPSDEGTLDKLARIAARRGLLVERIRRADLGRLAEYDALFIRTVTAIDHYSFTFAQAAESLGMPVIDDPASILKCSNKIFLYELFRKHDLPMPQTAVLSPKRLLEEARPLGYPVILKLPDGTFSQAVKMAKDEAELEALAREMFKRSPLILAQKFTPSSFDWRVGILAGRVIWTAKYHMAKAHWQIARRSKTGFTRYGKVEAVPAAEAPRAVAELALAGAALIGGGLYGVDLKETESGPVLIEINDNPNLEAGYEDAVEKDRPYEEILDYFLRSIEAESRPRRADEAGTT